MDKPEFGSVKAPDTIFTQPELFGYQPQLRGTQIFDEIDTYSKKRISLHKVAIAEPNTPHTEEKVQRYEYHMVIVDLCMTMNITLGEGAIINLIKSMK